MLKDNKEPPRSLASVCKDGPTPGSKGSGTGRAQPGVDQSENSRKGGPAFLQQLPAICKPHCERLQAAKECEEVYELWQC